MSLEFTVSTHIFTMTHEFHSNTANISGRNFGHALKHPIYKPVLSISRVVPDGWIRRVKCEFQTQGEADPVD